jgi:hypothetical protein
VLFQFANPKAWMMAVTAACGFSAGFAAAGGECRGSDSVATLAMALCFTCW